MCHLSLLRESEERRKVEKGPINCCLNGGSYLSRVSVAKTSTEEMDGDGAVLMIMPCLEK